MNISLRSFTPWNARQILVFFAAASVGLPIAWISIAKILVILVGLGYLTANLIAGKTDITLFGSNTTKAIVLAVVAFFVSLLWTQVSMDIALLATVKHAKLLVIPMLILLIRTRKDAQIGLYAFAATQTFVLLSSFLLAANIPLPWVTDPIGKFVVFSTYLDQSIMMSATAAVLWHLRDEGIWPFWFAALASSAALVDAVFLLDGRTGYAVAIAIVTLTVVWALPKRLRLAAVVLTPTLALLILFVSSNHIKSRLSEILQGGAEFSQHVQSKESSDWQPASSSSGWRLNAWHRSVQSMQERPWYGHGVGSWAVAVKRIEGAKAEEVFGVGNASNPHQEYLLWGVELGILGSILYIAILLAMARDARSFKLATQKAVWSVLAALAVASLFNSVLYDDLIGDFFCVTLGLLMALGFREAQEQEKAMK